MSERAYHHGNLRAEFLRHAWEAVDDAGAEALSLRQLARDAGVSHGASARHFRDKQALIDAIAVEGFERLNAAIREAASADAPFEARFRAVGLAYVGFAVAHPQILAVMYTAKHETSASEALLAVSHAGKNDLVALIVAAQEAGAIRAGDPEELAMIAFASVHGVASLATAGLLGETPMTDAAASVIGFVWAGLVAARPVRSGHASATRGQISANAWPDLAEPS
ncbi:TetR/AcrR family transcriptional regulator [Sinomonas sp. JGH33]|uniref:TetR/AcrR family transcriptional regulator n=1 Tax=Sinomonas terricola TaxID=3110330 RepID=A0ABU5T2Y9_9MICC|nr:TetR/AcrR family transcriptional regulator [Sinomonas sp. JGH33]MEA5454015.1 TetR/AcrR family transcriptional regulator [Sinomonas sp. JGH33]